MHALPWLSFHACALQTLKSTDAMASAMKGATKVSSGVVHSTCLHGPKASCRGGAQDMPALREASMGVSRTPAVTHTPFV